MKVEGPYSSNLLPEAERCNNQTNKILEITVKKKGPD